MNKRVNKAKLLQLAMDGPNVNWNVLNIMDNKLGSENFPKTLNIGSCAQRTVYEAFKDGFQKSFWKIGNLLKSAFWCLNDSPARRDIYLTEGSTNTFPIRFSGGCFLGLWAAFWFNFNYCLRSIVYLFFIYMFFLHYSQ